MRDAFGGAFMIRLFLVFIFIYMFFTAIALNYAKAFKVKNKIIDYLEDNEVIDVGGANANVMDKMEKYISHEVVDGLRYRITNMKCEHQLPEVYCDNGIIIYQYDAKADRSDSIGVYYKVKTFFAWDIGFLSILAKLGSDAPENDGSTGLWTISGETRTIIRQ